VGASTGEAVGLSCTCTTAAKREIYFMSHISWWEHSSHFRLIGRGVPRSVVSQLVYKFLNLASPRENPQVPICKIRSRTPNLRHRVRLHYP